ncbi:ubiquitin-associated domain-containing protein 1 isoform X2 [Periplaneta americana]|uniref:ubiquitin-associated domain-containing protein 1 isoform X2 n=1 Tax=Periplaneta americana TaxID=6978 RepID=UPI0037E76F16
MLPWMREKLYGSRQKLISILNRRCDSVPRSEVLDRGNMFVSDTNLFSSDLVKLSVISNEGGVWNIDAATDITVDKLKTMALCHFYNPLECVKVTPNYKLVLVSDKRPLDNDNSVLQEGLRDNDELLLVECRQPPSEEPFTADSSGGPTVEEINAATQEVEEKNTLKLHPPLECTADFQSEIRKILISLVEASARILTPSPNAEEVFEVIRERLDAKAKAEPDPRAIRQLMDMGFSEHAASRSLRLNRMNPSEALEWLLENGGEEEPEEQRTEAGSVDASAAVRPKKQQEAVPSTSVPSKPKKSQSQPQSVAQSVAALLESFRAYKRRDFKPNAKALLNLMDMGFPESDVRDALRITGNNQSAACEWLLGDRRPSLEDLDSGLDPESPIYKAIMSNPAIQLSLTSPKMLLAFLSMLENPSSANTWINDPDASPVLSQIFKTYHAEKHALQMNRYVEQQQAWSSRRS